jgi:hypothetical protein
MVILFLAPLLDVVPNLCVHEHLVLFELMRFVMQSLERVLQLLSTGSNQSSIGRGAFDGPFNGAAALNVERAGRREAQECVLYSTHSPIIPPPLRLLLCRPTLRLRLELVHFFSVRTPIEKPLNF